MAASSIASPPFGQNSHPRHLHHMQWNFMNFWLQKAWHCAVGVSALCCETHCVSPCDPTAVDTLTPDGSVTVPFDASWFCVDVDESPAVRLCSRDTFALITNASPQITAIQITIWRTGLPFEGAAFAMVLEGESGASVVGRYDPPGDFLGIHGRRGQRDSVDATAPVVGLCTGASRELVR